ncbi:MAG TPA: glycosyltransferase family 39 protein [Chthoniobacterales bacterium]
MSGSKWLIITWFVFILGIWAIRGLPWTLDDYDQAKQAYTSYEMVEAGNWWYQHNPRQTPATKPPLVGWVSAAIHQLTGNWDVAWRLPSFAAATAILLLLWNAGKCVGGDLGGFVATGAFAWNMLAIRLATLVRTDMVLTFFIFATGWLVWRRLQREEKWAWSDTAWMTLLLALAAMTKGPIYHAFLLPGLIVWSVLAKGNQNRGRIWLHYALASIVSVVPFLVWTWLRVRQDPTFYDQVVVKEFLGRFTTGQKAVHNNQTLYFYIPHLLAKCFPWSLAVIGAACFRSVRNYVRRDQATLWLACWALGALVVMSIVPSKRVDRIFPVVPVFALLLAAVVPLIKQKKAGVWLCVAGLLIFASYAVADVMVGYRQRQDALVKFGQQVREIVAARQWSYTVAEGRDEGMLLYLDQLRFLNAKDVAEKLKTGEINVAVVDTKALKTVESKIGKTDRLLEVRHPTEKRYGYYLIQATTAATGR